MVSVMEASCRVTLESPYSGGEAVNISATNHTCTKPARGLWVGGTGAVVVNMLDGTQVTFTAVPAGTELRIRFLSIVKVGTDASNMYALW